MTDEYTQYLKLPLPHWDNLLEEDLLRLRDALLRVDAYAAKVGVILASDDADLDTIKELVAAIKADKVTIDQLLTGKADAEAVNIALAALEKQLEGQLPKIDGKSLILEKGIWKVGEAWLTQQITQKTPYFDMETGKIYYPGYAGQFHDFQLSAPPENWKVYTGGWLDTADVSYSELWRNLHHPAFADLVLPDAEWTAKSAAAGGVGGVPFFVVDEAAKRIRLPDTRGDYTRAAGSSYLQTVGGWHDSAIVNITGRINRAQVATNGTSGGFSSVRNGESATSGNYYGNFDLIFDASTQVKTAGDNRTRSYAALGCVCVGPTQIQPSTP